MNLQASNAVWNRKQKTENREHVANPPSAWAGNKDITELICRRMLLFNVISNKPFIKFIAAPDTHSCVPAYKFSQNRLFHNFWKLYTPDYSKLQEMEDVGGKLTGFLRPWWTRNDIFNIWNRMSVPSSKAVFSPFKQTLVWIQEDTDNKESGKTCCL